MPSESRGIVVTELPSIISPGKLAVHSKCPFIPSSYGNVHNCPPNNFNRGFLFVCFKSSSSRAPWLMHLEPLLTKKCVPCLQPLCFAFLMLTLAAGQEQAILREVPTPWNGPPAPHPPRAGSQLGLNWAPFRAGCDWPSVKGLSVTPSEVRAAHGARALLGPEDVLILKGSPHGGYSCPSPTVSPAVPSPSQGHCLTQFLPPCPTCPPSSRLTGAPVNISSPLALVPCKS